MMLFTLDARPWLSSIVIYCQYYFYPGLVPSYTQLVLSLVAFVNRINGWINK